MYASRYVCLKKTQVYVKQNKQHIQEIRPGGLCLSPLDALYTSLCKLDFILLTNVNLCNLFVIRTRSILFNRLASVAKVTVKNKKRSR